MTKQEENRMRYQYKNLVDEINSACNFLSRECNAISKDTIDFIRETALGEAQLRFYQGKNKCIVNKSIMEGNRHAIDPMP